MGLEIVNRAQWGARHERGFGPAPLPADEVWLHHSVTGAPADDPAAERAAMRQLEEIGESRFGRGISYTFAVMPSGRVYEGHGVDRVGAHTGGRNSIARAIVLVGNYDTARVTNAQRHAVAALLRHGKAAGWWRHARLNGGHQQAPGAQTACPGRYGMAAIDDINQLAAVAGTDGGFLMALDADDQEQVKVGADRILGITEQRYWRKDGDQWVACGRNDPGAKPVTLPDRLDTAHLATRVGQLHQKVDVLAELVGKLIAQKEI